MKALLSAVSALVVLTLSNLAMADTVVFRNGDRISGTVSNQRNLERRARSLGYVSILIDRTDELRRVAIADISHVLLEDHYGTRIVDFGNAPFYGPRDEYREQRDTAIALMVGGGASALLGATVKMGHADPAFSDTQFSTGEPAYNVVNAIMIIGGAASVVVGLVLLADASDNAPVITDYRNRTMRVGFIGRF